MLQLLEKIGILAVVVGLSTPALAAPELSGRYRGSLGALRLSTEASTGWIRGQFESGGECGYLPGQGILEGELEGHVLVGRVFLCQSGPSCEAHFFPVLAIIDRDDGTLSAMVKLDPGCSSPALDEQGILLLQPAEQGEPATSALQLARGKVGKKAAERAQRSYLKAVRAVSSRPANFSRVKALALEAISYDPEHWQAYELLGVAEMELNNPAAAAVALKRSLELNRESADTHYNLACAYARLRQRALALESLKAAVRYGFDAAEHMEADPDLSAVFAGDPEFKVLAEEAARNHQKSEKGRRHQGRL